MRWDVEMNWSDSEMECFPSGIRSSPFLQRHCIPQSSSITGTSQSDCLVSYLGHSLLGVLLLCRDAVGVFFSPNRLSNSYSEKNWVTCCFWRKMWRYHHHHHIALVARISLTLSRHSSLSFIALGRSSGQHPVSSHSCWMYVRAGRPAFARPCVGIHKSTSLMSSSLLLQQCPACLVRLTWIVFVIGGRWPYSWCLVGCCCQDLFRIARSILV